MLSGARHTSAVKPCCFIISRTRSSFTLSTGYMSDSACGSIRFERVVSSFFALAFSPPPRRFFSFDQAPDRGMQWCRHGQALGFARDGATQKIHLGRQMMLNVVEHGGGMVSLGADFVHLPRIVVQFHAGSSRDALALIHQVTDEVAEI